MEHHNTHPFGPYVDSNSKILILGSFPSVRSRAQNFYYGHPQNRFWKVLAACVEDQVPNTLDEKKHFLSTHQIALWDVIDSCDISGSSDASIRNATPTEIKQLLEQTKFQWRPCEPNWKRSSPCRSLSFQRNSRKKRCGLGRCGLDPLSVPWLI